MPCALVEGVTTDRGHVAGYEAGYADGQRDAEAAAMEAERESIARIDSAVSALRRSVDAAQSAYKDRSDELESAVPRFAFDLLEVLFGRESVLAVDPAARPLPGHSPWRRARFPPSPGSLPTMPADRGTC